MARAGICVPMYNSVVLQLVSAAGVECYKMSDGNSRHITRHIVSIAQLSALMRLKFYSLKLIGTDAPFLVSSEQVVQMKMRSTYFSYRCMITLSDKITT